ncbi:MAG: hypothetical protein KDA81_18975, partial [Planctomycetaceae bacterium]|nr:hypothetical protein [Planctomycetaceae bacterium]
MLAGTSDELVDAQLSPPIQDQILAVLASLDAGARDVGNSDALNREIPGVGRSLNGLLEDGTSHVTRWGDLVMLEQVAAGYFQKFDSSSTNFDPASVGQQPTAYGLRDALAAQVTISPEFQGMNGDAAVMVSGGIDAETNQLRFGILVHAERTQNVHLSFDALGADWTNLNIELNADATVDVVTTVDLALSFGMGLNQDTGNDPFFDLQKFNIRTDVNADDATFGFAMGPVDGTISATKLDITADASIVLPPGAAAIEDRLRLTTGTSPFNLDFDFSGSLYGNALGATPPNLPGILVSDADLFDNSAPTFNVDLAPLLLNLSAEHVVGGLLQLADSLDDVIGSDSLDQPIPLINKSLHELLTSPAQPRRFSGNEITSISTSVVDGDVQRFMATLDTGGRSVSSLGIKPGDLVTFLAEGGDRFGATVESVGTDVVTLTYAAARNDKPDATSLQSLEFHVGGSIGDQLRSALGNYNKPGAVVPTIGRLLNELSGPLGIDFGAIGFDETTKTLTLTPTFAPEPIQFESKLDFGDSIVGLEFDASGRFMLTAEPVIRLPLGINLDPDATLSASDRVFVIEDVEPEVTISLSANIDDPHARASLGFLSAVLEESTDNNGIVLNTTVTVNIVDPKTGSGLNAQSTPTEIAGALTDSLEVNFGGSLDIEGLVIRPEVAGTTIPGEITISTAGPTSFSGFGQLGSLLDDVSVTNTIGSFDSLTPDAVVTMLLQLGNSLQSIAGELNVPDGIPFVDDAISEVVDFTESAGDFARRFYFNASLVGDNDISVTDGVLSGDAMITLRAEGSEPVFVTIPAASTADNQSIDDLYVDINEAFKSAGLDGFLIAERQRSFDATQVETVSDVSAAAVGPAVAPLNGLKRYRFSFAPGIDLFNLGLKIGDVINYTDVSGQTQRAAIDELSQSSLSVRFDGSKQSAPATGISRGVNLFDPAHTNRLAIRTVSPEFGTSMAVSTVAATAAGTLPTQLLDDLTFEIAVNDEASQSVTVPASSTTDNLTAADMVASINAAIETS